MEDSQPIRPLDQMGECDCVDFRKWKLPCQHMLELQIFIGIDVELDWERYASIFDDSMFDVYKGQKVEIAMVEARMDS